MLVASRVASRSHVLGGPIPCQPAGIARERNGSPPAFFLGWPSRLRTGSSSSFFYYFSEKKIRFETLEILKKKI
jgi:hypothetical protein